MPTNLYGPNDNYHPENSHVLPALIRKVLIAKKKNEPYVTIWGTGTPKRDFLHVDDLADACLFLLNSYDNNDVINIGSGSDISINDLIKIIFSIINYKGELKFNFEMPDGTKKKLLDTEIINSLGWNPKIKLEEGLKSVIKDVKNNF